MSSNNIRNDMTNPSFAEDEVVRGMLNADDLLFNSAISNNNKRGNDLSMLLIRKSPLHTWCFASISAMSKLPRPCLCITCLPKLSQDALSQFHS